MKLLFLLAFATLLLVPSANAQTSAPDSSIYSVAVYDPARNPADDLAATITRATAENKRILLKVGGDWCTWCRALERFIGENENVGTALREHYVVMKVNVDDINRNESFLSQYPKVPGYPHIFVLEKDGAFLHSQGTGELEEGKSYSETTLLTFLEEWRPRP